MLKILGNDDDDYDDDDCDVLNVKRGRDCLLSRSSLSYISRL